MRVLIIDDEEDTRSIFSMSLGLLGGAEVIEAGSGPAGIEMAAAENPDVIILDLLMPGMDGSQTFIELKNRPDTACIPVIFMTVKGMFSEFDALKSMGALAVIAKPFDPTTLTQQIKTILTTHGFQPENGENLSGHLNNVEPEIDPAAASGEMIVSDESNRSSDSVEVASGKRRPALPVAASSKYVRRKRSKAPKLSRITERIIAKKRPGGRSRACKVV